MTRKNNNRITEKAQQHFSIRKLTVGVASVLIGMTFLGTENNQVHAAETDTDATQTEVTSQEGQQDNKAKQEVELASDSQKNDQVSTETTQNKVQANAVSHQDDVANTSVANKNTQNNNQQATNDQQTQIATSRQTENVTLTDNEAQVGLTNNEKALLPANGNTISEKPKINNQDGMTNVPKNGTVEYDYSISAKDKTTGKVEEVHSAAEYKDNTAYLNKKQAEDIQAHITLTNISDQDQTIGNNNSSNNDGAQLFVNVYNPYHNSSLIVSSDVAPSVTYFDKDGNVISGDSMTVLYRDKNGNWYTYDDFKQKVSPEDYRFITSIGYKGVLPANTTAKLNVPLAINPDTPTGSNQFAIFAVQQKSININVIDNTNPLWTMDEVKNDKPYLTFRNPDGTYQLIPSSDAEAIEKEMPTMGAVLKIVNSGLNIPGTANQFYVGGTFRINLPQIQEVLKKYGYSVLIKENKGNNGLEIMPYYTYSTVGGLVIKNSDGTGLAPIMDSNKPFFYIEVHKIIDTQDSTFVQGSTGAQNWDYLNNVIGVTNLEHPTSVSNGTAWNDVPGQNSEVKLVSIKDANGNTIQTINGDTPAGVYNVTVSYKLDQSTNPELLIEKTYTVTITPKSQPTQPTNPTQPTEPVSPTTPVEPTSPVQPSSAESVRPLPQKPTDNSGKENKENKVAGSDVATQSQASKNNIKKLSNNDEQAKETLPQTGQKESALAFWGIAIASLAGILGMANRKKEN